jgi:hypothetical protein
LATVREPTIWTNIAEWKSTLRAEIRVTKRLKFALQLRSLRLRLRMLVLGLQIFVLNTPDYLSALLVAVFRSHRISPP